MHQIWVSLALIKSLDAAKLQKICHKALKAVNREKYLIKSGVMLGIEFRKGKKIGKLESVYRFTGKMT